MVGFASGLRIQHGLQISHLCDQPLCTIPSHVTIESARQNNARKGCLGYISCPHCELKILICQHNPLCICWAPGFINQDDFLKNGIH
ncbi:hypothetical protein RB213_000935 [Colletotrichum asianum]